MDVKVLVAAHKPYWMSDDDIYLPIHVGAVGKESFLSARDDIGENISAKNPNYCELTALYWAWKNLNCEYIGLCHYRRYFGHWVCSNNVEKKKENILQRKDYEELLGKYDVILPRRFTFKRETIYSQYEHSHYKSDLEEIRRIILRKYPEYAPDFDKTMKSREIFFYNMFVMRKALFASYCEWLFRILFEAEKRIDISGRDQIQTRAFGYLGERLFNVWLEHCHLREVEVPVLNLEENLSLIKMGKRWLRHVFA